MKSVESITFGYKLSKGNQVNIPEPASDAMGGRSMEDHPGVGSPGCLA